MVSRPSSGWDRVGHRRHGHQAVEPAFRAIDACFSEPRAPPATSVALAILAQARLLRLIDHGCHHLRGERRDVRRTPRSEEHTSELQSLMRISYAVFCLKKKKLTNKLT